MNFFKKQTNGNRGGNPPNAIENLTASLTAKIWQKERDGKTLFWWSLARRDDNGKTYITKRPEHLTQMPEFVAKLSEAFANSSAIDERLRERLLRQSAFLYQLAQTNRDESQAEVDEVSNGLSFAS